MQKQKNKNRKFKKIAELFLICFKVNDETTQRELENLIKLPLHAEVQNEMFFRFEDGLQVRGR